MDRIMYEILTFVFSATSYVHKGDVPAAILLLLMELGFQTHTDGFGYLRKAIFLKYNNPGMRMSAIVQEIVKMSDDAVGTKQIEQAICSAIETAWADRDEEKWGLIFYDKLEKPTNKVFVARIACIMELWNSCREVSDGTE